MENTSWSADDDFFEPLSLEEKHIIEMIRNKKFQSLRVVKKNGRIDMIESVERVAKRLRIVDILKQHDYQNIEIIQSDGCIVHISRTIKTKI